MRTIVSEKHLFMMNSANTWIWENIVSALASVRFVLSQAEKEGQLINSDFTVITETFHKGSLPETYSGIKLSAENIAVTGLKKYEDGEGWVLRCYETENKKTTVQFSLFGTELETEFSNGEVKTFIINKNEVKEADFMEWQRS